MSKRSLWISLEEKIVGNQGGIVNDYLLSLSLSLRGNSNSVIAAGVESLDSLGQGTRGNGVRIICDHFASEFIANLARTSCALLCLLSCTADDPMEARGIRVSRNDMESGNILFYRQPHGETGLSRLVETNIPGIALSLFIGKFF